MDEFARKLREDADRIQATVSPELDAHIRASLESARAEAQGRRHSGPPPVRFWIATTLTGAALAAALVLALNLRSPVPETPATGAALAALELPELSFRVEPAVLTSPLEEEYERLQGDIRKAEQAVREDLEAAF